ncbi:MAG: hypothetical protein WBQ20_08635 [Methyloceanibacter sp.]
MIRRLLDGKSWSRTLRRISTSKALTASSMSNIAAGKHAKSQSTATSFWNCTTATIPAG